MGLNASCPPFPYAYATAFVPSVLLFGDGTFRGHFVSMRSWGWGLRDEIHVLLRRGRDTRALLAAPWSCTSSLQNWEEVNSCCLSHPVYDILLWQLELRHLENAGEWWECGLDYLIKEAKIWKAWGFFSDVGKVLSRTHTESLLEGRSQDQVPKTWGVACPSERRGKSVCKYRPLETASVLSQQKGQGPFQTVVLM